jgi:DNA-binding NarL/FixJ family response regulator
VPDSSGYTRLASYTEGYAASIDADSIAEEKKLNKQSLFPEMMAPPAFEREPKGKTQKRGKGLRHCKKCGEAGHRSDHCPQDGASYGTVKEKILDLKDEGLTSEEIADRLGISIRAVNKYW